MQVSFKCRHCDSPCAADRTQLGRSVHCPHCGKEIRVPGTIEKEAIGGSRRFASVRVQSGPAFEGREIDLDPDRSYTFGRSDQCDFQLPDRSVSRRHFSLHWVSHRWVIEDLNSTSGTEVNGIAVSKRELKQGDAITVGAFRLEYQTPRSSRTTVAVPHVIPSTLQPEALSISHEDAAERQIAVHAAEQELRASDIHFEHTTEYQQQTARLAGREALKLRLKRAGVLAVLAALLIVVPLVWRSLSSSVPNRRNTHERDASIPAPLPEAFVAALKSHDFDGANRQIADAEANPTSPTGMGERMRNELRSAVAVRNGSLLATARRALGEKDWKGYQAIAAAAGQPAFERFTREWDEIAHEALILMTLDQAETLRSAGDFAGARAKLDGLPSQSSQDYRVRSLIGEITRDLGAGLRVVVEGGVAAALVVVGEKELGSPGDHWGLPSGPATIVINAAGYFPHESEIQLRVGDLAILEVSLRPLPEPAEWSLALLEKHGSNAATWLAAKCYSAGGDEFAAALAAAREADARSAAAQKNLRVASVTLKSGETVTGQVWGQSSMGLSMRRFSDGEAKVIPLAEIATTTELAGNERLCAYAEYFSAPSEPLPPMETLETLGCLIVDMGPTIELRCDQAIPLVRSLLAQLEQSCLACVAAGSTACGHCGESGRVTVRGPCDNCNATGRVRCFDCKGSRTERCTRCGGDGKITRRRNQGGTFQQPVQATCPTCQGSGKQPCKACKQSGDVACPKCKGAREIDNQERCPECGGQRKIACADCGGSGKKSDVPPDLILDAEESVAEWVASARQ